MTSLKTKLCGIEMDSPFVLGSGPLSYSADGLIAASKAGCGAVVTKTILPEAAVNPVPHMWKSGNNSLINSELWADYDAERWLNEEIPKAKEGGVKVLIANCGGTTEEAVEIAKRAEKAGADIIEIGCGYLDPGDFWTRTKSVKEAVSIPVLVKVNYNWKNTPEVALQCLEAGASGITAMDSIGPAFRIDINTGKPVVGGDDGYGWITGESILPFTMRVVHDIALKANSEIIGLGGIIKASDAVEMLMAGATACGICTAPIMRGINYVTQLNKDLASLMEKLGYSSIEEMSRKSIKVGIQDTPYSPEHFRFDNSKCTHCGKCQTVCCYSARKLTSDANTVDSSRCRSCGLCFSSCPTGAIFLK